jgi:quinoprotein glucose dehydrogenase
VYALVPETGQLLWKYATTPVALRGLAYWAGGRGLNPRVFVGNGPFLLALDVTTGKPAPGFANEGRLDLKAVALGDLKDARYALQSPPAVFGDVVITGCSNGEGSPTAGAYGDIRGWDAKTGKLLWTFHTVPRPGEPGADTWPPNAWKNRSGTNVWGFFTVDDKRGIVYAPIGAPTSDFYGADRVGDGLYGNSLVALDALTGERKWSHQLVHHDLWDYDLAAPPALFDIHRSGRVIPAVAEITKMGLLFVFDRVTGEPVYGMEERPVPQSTVPGEVTSKTQPFPLKPPPLARVSFSHDDIVTANDTTPEHAKACQEIWDKFGGLYNNGPFTTLPYHAKGAQTKPAIIFPGLTGGANWGGTATDPKLGYIFVNTKDMPLTGWMEDNPHYTPDNPNGLVPYIRTGPQGLGFFGAVVRDSDGKTIGNWPCFKPPWGRLIAVNANTGDFAWEVPLGLTESLPPGKQNTGTNSLAGPIATAGGLVFIGATNDNRFRAFDSKTGKELWTAKLDYTATAVPITYQGKDGKQYVAIVAASGGGGGGRGRGRGEAAASDQGLVVFKLP